MNSNEYYRSEKHKSVYKITDVLCCYEQVVYDGKETGVVGRVFGGYGAVNTWVFTCNCHSSYDDLVTISAKEYDQVKYAVLTKGQQEK